MRRMLGDAMPPHAPHGARDVSVLVAPGCNLGCAVCDCRTSAAPSDPSGVPFELERGGRSAEFRGEVAMQRLAPVIAEARKRGFRTIRVRTNGVAFRSPQAAAGLLDMGVDEVVLFFPADRPGVFDAITRVRGAQAAALAGARGLAASGLPLILEVPVLDRSVQDLRKTIDLVAQAASTLRAVRMYSPAALVSPDGKVPRQLAPPRWDDIKPQLLCAIDRARELGLSVGLSDRDGVPLCALTTASPDGRESVPRGVFTDRGKRRVARGPTSQIGPGCRDCRAAQQCPGTTELYLALHGQSGLTPIRHARLGGLSSRAGAEWGEARRQAARDNPVAVLRPTVHCNQDCLFCSANETSNNLADDPDKMVRRIARLARGNVRWVSFSGGEPTLVPQLVDFVAVARQAGIPRVELVTNAVKLDTPERVQALLDAGLTDLFVSLHAHDEQLSSTLTRKDGDHARTVRAVRLFAEMSNVHLSVNHVLSVYNFRTIGRFVDWLHDEFGTRVRLSIAYVTPQYKALERLSELVPRYADAMPPLHKALGRARELGLEVVVGSRQGVPPCQLGEFVSFSDVLKVCHGAAVEDSFQKCKSPRCASCRFDLICSGVWKSYADMYGTGELVPVDGPRITVAQAEGFQMARDHDPGARRAGEAAFLQEGGVPAQAAAVGAGRLAEGALRVQRSPGAEALRVAIAGTGQRAVVLAAGLQRTGDFQAVGLVSPHAVEKDLPALTARMDRARSLEELCSMQHLDAVLVASSTESHAGLARACLARGLPCLVEKPLAASVDEAEALAGQGGERIGVIQQLRYAAGLQELAAELRLSGGPAALARVMVRRFAPKGSRDSLPAWSRDSLFQLLIHHGDVAAFLLDGGQLGVSRASWHGESPPERVRIDARSSLFPSLPVQIDLWFAAPSEGIWVEAKLQSGNLLQWTRRQHAEQLRVVGPAGERCRVPAHGGDLELLLAAWARSLRNGAPPPVSARDGVCAMRFANEAIAALEHAAIPFARSSEPKHGSSRKVPAYPSDVGTWS